jgi:hypothetical protein
MLLSANPVGLPTDDCAHDFAGQIMTNLGGICMMVPPKPTKGEENSVARNVYELLTSAAPYFAAMVEECRQEQEARIKRRKLEPDPMKTPPRATPVRVDAATPPISLPTVTAPPIPPTPPIPVGPLAPLGPRKHKLYKIVPPPPNVHRVRARRVKWENKQKDLREASAKLYHAETIERRAYYLPPAYKYLAWACEMPMRRGPLAIMQSAKVLDEDPRLANISLQHVHVIFCTLPETPPRYQYVVPRFCNMQTEEGIQHILEFDWRRRLADHRVLMTDAVTFGRYGGTGLRWIDIVRRDREYIQWIRNKEADMSPMLRSVQVCIWKWDRKRNVRIAWRRAFCRFRFASALWWAAEQGAIKRGAYATPDMASVAADLPGLVA